jgi:hypothetical protein
LRAEVNRLASELRNKDERAAQARRLPDVVRALDEAATFGEVLETLAVRAGCEAGRAAVFLVKGNRLRDWRTVGFDFPSDSSRLDIDVNASGPIAEAVRSGEGVSSSAANSVPEFARTEEPRKWPRGRCRWAALLSPCCMQMVRLADKAGRALLACCFSMFSPGMPGECSRQSQCGRPRG